MIEAVEKVFRVRLAIPLSEIEKLYRGDAQTVSARATTGENLRFPARSLRPFLGKEGIQGLFEIRTDRDNRLIAINRCE